MIHKNENGMCSDLLIILPLSIKLAHNERLHQRNYIDGKWFFPVLQESTRVTERKLMTRQTIKYEVRMIQMHSLRARSFSAVALRVI